MDEKFLQDAFSFHQTLFKDLNDRMWDSCTNDDIKSKMDFAFKLCYGDDFVENPVLDKNTSTIRRKFFEVSKKDDEGNRLFNCLFLYNKLKKNGAHWITVLFFTTTQDNSEVIIDKDCRQYKTFEDFLENNVYPKCFMTFPDKGRYKGRNYVLLNCAWSKSCGIIQDTKKCLNVVSAVGTVAASGVLFSNPVGIPFVAAQAGFWAASAYSLFRGFINLKDAADHNGGYSSEKALVAAIDIALTTGGMLTLGTASAIKAISTSSGKVLIEGTVAYKAVLNLNRCFQVLSVSGAGIYLVLVVNKWKEGTLTPNDLLSLSKYILFSFNCFVSIELLKKMLADLAGYISKVSIEVLLRKKNDVYIFVKKAVRFLRSEQYTDLLNELFPNRITQLYKELDPVRQNINEMVVLVSDVTGGCINRARFISGMVTCTSNLHQNIICALQNEENEISRLLNSEIWKPVCKWSEENKKKHIYNTYYKKIEMMDDLKRTMLECTQQMVNENKERMFLEFMLSLIGQQNVENNYEAMKKIRFYSKIFGDELAKAIRESVFARFKVNAEIVYKNGKGACPGVVSEEYDFLQSCFDHVMSKMLSNLELYNTQLTEVDDADSEPTNCAKLVYIFNRQMTTDVVESDIYFDIANTFTDLGVNKNNSTFCPYRDNIFSIRLKEDSKMLIFMSKNQNGFLKGIMVCIPSF